MSQSILTLKDIGYSYHSLNGEVPALQNICFEVENEKKTLNESLEVQRKIMVSGTHRYLEKPE